jgi:hypothetical protein
MLATDATAMPLWAVGSDGLHQIFVARLLTMGGAVAMAVALGLGVAAVRSIIEAKRWFSRRARG